MAQSVTQILTDIQSQLDDLAAGLVAIPRGPGSIKNGMIAPNSVQATNINVQKLAAVSSQTGDLSVTGSLTMTAAGVFSAGQTAYNTGVGWWLEGNSGTPRFSLGDSSAAHLTWDGSALSIVGANLILDSGGTFGDVFLMQHSGTDQGAMYASATGLFLIQGTPTSQGSNLFLGTSAFSLSNGTTTVIASTGSNLQFSGSVFLGNQATRSIGDDGSNTTVSSGLSVGGGIVMVGGLKLGAGWTGTTATGTLPSPTKWILFENSAGTSYYVPAFSSPNGWTA